MFHMITGPSHDRLATRTMAVYYDDDMAELIEQFSWHLHPWGEGNLYYAQTKVLTRYQDWFPGIKQITMHQLVMHGRGRGRIGHVDGNGLNNRRANLRFMTQSMILAKRKPPRQTGGRATASPYKGVSWDTHHGKWVARFRGKSLGRFTDDVSAAKAFDAAAWDYWGDLAYQNFPDAAEESA